MGKESASPLHIAIKNNDIEIIQELINYCVLNMS